MNTTAIALCLMTTTVFLTACDDDKAENLPMLSGCGEPVMSELDSGSDSAKYCVTFSAKWDSTTFEPVPANAHFSDLIGAAVNLESQLWQPGQLASAGLEEVAETGLINAFSNEIKAELAANTALQLLSVKGTGAVEDTSFALALNRSYPLYSFATMIAPSPDWFVGLSRFSLLNENGQWLESVNVDLPAYDAGTESGDFFSLAGTATNPAQPVSRLNVNINDNIVFSNGSVQGRYLASMRFVRIE